jgi:hypothetical protein
VNQNGKRPNPPDLSSYQHNRCNYPPEKLLQYAGQYIAWNLEGTEVLASGEAMEIVEQKLMAMGILPNMVVGDYIDALDPVEPT